MKNDKPNVFQECERIPFWCRCECGMYERLFTKEAQLKNLELKGMYRVFANTTHRDRYLKLMKN